MKLNTSVSASITIECWTKSDTLSVEELVSKHINLGNTVLEVDYETERVKVALPGG